jgi:hypothetical protein
MIVSIEDIDLKDPAIQHTIESAEQNLLFLGTHSTTGRLLIQFVQGEEAVAFEIVRSDLRTQILSLLLDGVGNNLSMLRQEEAAHA